MTAEATVCPSCGDRFAQGGRGRRRRYCSDACRRRAHRERVANEQFVVPLLVQPTAARRAASSDEDVARTLLDAGRLCADLRRHAVGAPPQLALKCEIVLKALSAAMAEQFGDAFAPPPRKTEDLEPELGAGSG